MVLNNDVKRINLQVLPFCIYGPGYDERYPMVAIIKIRQMLHLQSITCLEHFSKFDVNNGLKRMMTLECWSIFVC